MSKQRKTIRDIQAYKGQTPIVCLTAYTAPNARLLDKHVDILLVGDSLGMVLYGFETTAAVTLDMMIMHGKAVVNNSKKAVVVVDMPFGSYQKNKEQAYDNCAAIIAQTNCTAVKLEGGSEIVETINFLTQRGIAVMGHVGLLPQSVHAQGGYRTHGKTTNEYNKILSDAKSMASAGAFAIVLESVTKELAEEITATIDIPTIGIGASVNCDGQVLVTEDMTGLLETPPKFVKQYGTAAHELENAAKAFAKDVRARNFPSAEQTVTSSRKHLKAL